MQPVHVSYVKYKEFVLHHTVSLGNLEGEFHFFLTHVARQRWVVYVMPHLLYISLH